METEDLQSLIADLESKLEKLKAAAGSGDGEVIRSRAADYSKKAAKVGSFSNIGAERVIEGVFDGTRMIGPDGKQYSIPANYISKSKLVEGDILKLTIDTEGNFIYKQIGPVTRDRLIGTLMKEEMSGDYYVSAAGRKYKVILASVTYFKGDAGDEVVILVPKDGQSAWAAIENIIKKA
ncbi:MAG: hypothetical protein NTV81_02915 [Candidatus Komeilibacteria bacterium]|nr:hypothetical protein [Candidatus Komeilibacteria bacterium]